MSWISVVNSIPEEMEEVIIFDNSLGIVIGFYYPFSNSFIGSVDGTRVNPCQLLDAVARVACA